MRSMLYRVPPDKRAEVLALVSKQEADERAEYERTGGLISFKASDLKNLARLALPLEHDHAAQKPRGSGVRPQHPKQP